VIPVFSTAVPSTLGVVLASNILVATIEMITIQQHQEQQEQPE